MRRIYLLLSCLALAIVAGLHVGASLAGASLSHPVKPSRLAPGQLSPGQISNTDLCGSIPPGVTLDRAASPYTVTCDLMVSATLQIEPGVEIRFEPGTALTVKEGVLLATGTETLPITFTSSAAMPQPGDWAGLRFEAGSSASRLDWCVVEYANVGVHVYAGPGTVVSPALADCTVRRNAARGVMVEAEPGGCDAALAEPTVSGCKIEDNGDCGFYGYGHGNETAGCIPKKSGSVGGTVSRSTIRNNERSGICLRSKSDASSHGEVWTRLGGNNISANGEHGIYMYGTDPVHPHIENNLIYGNAGTGIAWEAEQGDGDLPVVNNTVVANGGDGMLFYGPAGQVQVVNNLLVGNTGHGLECAGAPYPAVSYNDVWSNTAGDYAGCPPGTADLSADPLFANAAEADYHLQLGSPCIDAGTALGGPAVDVEGIPRPQGSGFDIGAYEFWGPEIEVTQGGQQIAAGSRYDFGRLEVGTSRSALFSIENAGNKSLQVKAIQVTPSGPFSLVSTTTFPLTVGQAASTTFAVRFAPTATGEQEAAVFIHSDDSDEDPFPFFVAGQGVQGLMSLDLAGLASGLVEIVHTFTATAGPLETTQPITYTWQATEQPPRTHSGGLSDTANYVWSTPGIQVVTVTAANIQNALTRTHLISLYAPARADFAGMPTSGTVPLLVRFENLSTGDYATNRWEFGDGLSSTLPNPAHTYQTVGVYTVSLAIEGPGGSDEMIRRGYIAVEGRRIYLPLIVRGLGLGAASAAVPQSNRNTEATE